MRSESWKFIWQPNVSMRYFFAIFLGDSPTFAFAFRLSPDFALRASSRQAPAGPKRPAPELGLPRALRLPGAAGPLGPGAEQLTRARPHLLGHRRPANHSRQFLDASVVVQMLHVRDRP